MENIYVRFSRELTAIEHALMQMLRNKINLSQQERTSLVEDIDILAGLLNSGPPVSAYSLEERRRYA